MCNQATELLRKSLDDEGYRKLTAIRSPAVLAFAAEAIRLCEPDSVFVCTDSPEDIAAVRRMAIETGEETPLRTEGHTVHFDGYVNHKVHDQGRDKENTRYLAAPGTNLGDSINVIDREEGLAEVLGFLSGSMVGRRMLVRFFCLGPTDSVFSIPAMQITDSSYVAHSEDLLFRAGYEQFVNLGESVEFFRVLHSAGRLENNVSVDVDKRRIYVDLEEGVVYSVNTQYAGNTVGFKKLSLRLAIRKADREGWLAEHMFIMGAHGPGGRVTYMVGAFPSFCGKTSTSMIEGETIIGDDLAYLRKIGGEVRAANVECGMFGVIRNVNRTDDPLIWEAITSPGEVIFSNVLVSDGVPYWLGDGREHPREGTNYAGEWHEGDVDDAGEEVTCSHKNARFTIRLSALQNLDENADAPEGVPVGGIIYGGRDSDTCVPVQQSFDWTHGVITMAAALESETTAATIGQEGVRVFQPMSNLDFVSLPLGRYVNNHLKFVAGLADPPLIFAVNYFQRDEGGEYLTGMNAKRVWLKWMELRRHGDVAAVTAPTGYIPRWDDLAGLFHDVLGQDYAEEDYARQFAIRVTENLAKIERIEEIYRTRVSDTPSVLFEVLDAQRGRLLDARGRFGDRIDPRLLR